MYPSRTYQLILHYEEVSRSKYYWRWLIEGLIVRLLRFRAEESVEGFDATLQLNFRVACGLGVRYSLLLKMNE